MDGAWGDSLASRSGDSITRTGPTNHCPGWQMACVRALIAGIFARTVPPPHTETATMLDILGQMVLGLGLFFIGMHLVGENLRHLSSRSFRTLVARFTADSIRGSLLGLVFGALMQSATAV